MLKDVAFRICPITDADARAMLDELRGAALLDGARGQAAADRQALVRALMAVGGKGGLLETLGEDLAELDINPLIASSTGVRAVDARFVLTPGRDAAQAGRAVSASPHGQRGPGLLPPAVPPAHGGRSGGVDAQRRDRQHLYPAAEGLRLRWGHLSHPPQRTGGGGLPAYPSLADTPQPVDYASVAIGAARIPDVLGAAAGRCRLRAGDFLRLR